MSEVIRYCSEVWALRSSLPSALAFVSSISHEKNPDRAGLRLIEHGEQNGEAMLSKAKKENRCWTKHN